MGVRSIPSPASITKEEFEKYLDRYDSCIEAVSQSKGSRHGERSLLDLDEYRYGEAVATFGSTPPKREMELEDVKTLVHWKL
ncbi:hypothetical protein VTK73DRAFT_8486 [Phialemonium thermophilum]|uniref:Uncharacterized protein n=1 Tax=Phialemonium thermophilum TaxID=223376 RepID=A0ABR3W867_9PEZI